MITFCYIIQKCFNLKYSKRFSLPDSQMLLSKAQAKGQIAHLLKGNQPKEAKLESQIQEVSAWTTQVAGARQSAALRRDFFNLCFRFRYPLQQGCEPIIFWLQCSQRLIWTTFCMYYMYNKRFFVSMYLQVKGLLRYFLKRTWRTFKKFTNSKFS